MKHQGDIERGAAGTGWQAFYVDGVAAAEGIPWES